MNVNDVDPDQTPRWAVSYLDLYCLQMSCLQMSCLWDSRHNKRSKQTKSSIKIRMLYTLKDAINASKKKFSKRRLNDMTKKIKYSDKTARMHRPIKNSYILFYLSFAIKYKRTFRDLLTVISMCARSLNILILYFNLSYFSVLSLCYPCVFLFLSSCSFIASFCGYSMRVSCYWESLKVACL